VFIGSLINQSKVNFGFKGSIITKLRVMGNCSRPGFLVDTDFSTHGIFGVHPVIGIQLDSSHLKRLVGFGGLVDVGLIRKVTEIEVKIISFPTYK